MIVIYLIAKDKIVGVIYGDSIDIKDKEAYIISRSRIIASIDFDKLEKTREYSYDAYIKI